MDNKIHIKAIKNAFPSTIPILTGFIFLGITFGMYMTSLGHPAWMAVLMSAVIFAGSVEFVAATMLIGVFNPLSAFILTLMVNARHLFYGISMLDHFRGTGKKKGYLIFGMCDETFVINQTINVPKGVDKGLVMFYVTLFNHIYWVMGSFFGSIIGSLITFNLEGLEFVMAALFLVVFLEQWYKGGKRFASLGVLISIICFIIFGASYFVLPTMIALLIVFILFKRPLTEIGDKA
ncbi:AzlC family ABC transporter permease [Macrococcus animalis]|uniref:AzlC family ABC transporter permease n=1 Tax=Macrococcus animalis TaxID=3395467 RepID=UPI0039BE579A